MGHSQSAVSAGHELAARIAHDVLLDGGNAIDAGVAASIALCVLHSEQVQIGGVAPMLIRPAGSRKVLVVEGVGRWPAAADAEFFRREHNGRVPKGVLRSVVPAAPDAWLTALARFGTRSFAELAAPARDLARYGFPAHADLAAASVRFRRSYEREPDNARIWMPGGEPIDPGQIFQQAELAETLSRLIDADTSASGRTDRKSGLCAVRRYFYEGDMARTMASHVTGRGGWLSSSDLAAHVTPVKPAVTAPVIGGRLHMCGPWSQGPALGQALMILENSVPEGVPGDAPEFWHLALEAMKLAIADREAFYGDPDFIDVPLASLLSREYAAGRAGLIRPDEAWPDLPLPGSPDLKVAAPVISPRAETDATPTLDTSVVAVADSTGNAFACTPSDGSYDSPVVPGLGFVISTRGGQSYVSPDHPAVMGPGRRPRITACPFLLETADGRTVFGGGPGADQQLQASVQVLARHLFGGESMESAIAAPRYFTQCCPASSEPHLSFPGMVSVEDETDPATVSALTSLGHNVAKNTAKGIAQPSVCLVETYRGSGASRAYGDHRRQGGQFPPPFAG